MTGVDPTVAVAAASACGTYGGYQRHSKAGEPPCEPCKDARRQYTADYRQRHPESIRQATRHARLRMTALARLADLYPRDYDRLFREVVAEEWS